MIKCTLIGYGNWGKRIARVLREHPKAELTFVADTNPKAMADLSMKVRWDLANEHDVRDHGTDAVFIATPPKTHAYYAKLVLESGAHVFVEKPMSISTDGSTELLSASLRCEKRQVLQVGHTFLYDPAIRKLKQLIESCELGEIQYIDTQRVNLGRYQSDGTDVIVDLLPHDASILIYLLGEAPYDVIATGRRCNGAVYDVASVTMKFQKAIAFSHVSWLSPVKLRRIVVSGTKKMAVLDDGERDRLKIYDRGVELPSGADFGRFQLTYREGDVWVPYIKPSEPLWNEIDEFLTSIETGATVLSDASLGHQVVRVIELAQDSLKYGQL